MWIAFAAIVGVILVVLAAVLGARRFAEQRIEQDVRATLERTSAFAAIAAGENIDRLVDVVTNVAADPDLARELDGEGRRAPLDEAAARMRRAEGVRVGFVVAPDSTVLGMDPVDDAVIGQRFVERDWYRGVRRQSPYLSEAYEIAAFDQPHAVTIAAQVRRGDRVVGIVTVVVETERLGRAIERVEEVDESPTLAIVDQAGGVVAGSLVADADEALVHRTEIDGTGGWQVVAAADRDDAFADLVDVRRAATALMAVVCTLLLVLAAILLLNMRRLARARRVTERQEQAFELNDTIVQRLVVAQMALSLGQATVAVEQLDLAIESAREIIGELAEGRADYVRDVAADGSSPPGPKAVA